MTFDDTHKQYSRLEAMRVAKEQASIREKAADYVRDGKQIPDELVLKYNKALRSKLCVGSGSPRVAEATAAPAAATTQPPPVPAAPVASAKGASLTTSAAVEPSAPLFALISHRGISLNGLPYAQSPVSYAPPSAGSSISRSWSGTAFAQQQVSSSAMVFASSVTGHAVPSVTVTTAPRLNAAPVTTSTVGTVAGLSLGQAVQPQAILSGKPLVSAKRSVQPQAAPMPMSPSPPARPVATSRSLLPGGPRPTCLTL